MDILDTSALQAMSSADIAIISKHRRIVVPSVAIWELLCHLDELVDGCNPQLSFERRRGQILKALNLELLNDSRLSWTQTAKGSDAVHPHMLLEAAVTKA